MNSKEGGVKFAEALSAFEKVMPEMRSVVQNMADVAPTLRFAGKGSIEEHLADLNKSFNQLKMGTLAVAKQAQQAQRTKGKTPAPEAAKEEPAYEKRLRDTLKTSHARFLGTVDKLLNGLVKALQDPAKEAEANRMLKGKLSETIDWLKALRKQKAPATLAERNTLNGYNNILWNSYLGPLRRNPKLADVFAAAKSDRLVREAAPPPQPGIPGAPVGPLGQPTTPAKKAPGGKPTRRPVEKRDDIGQLQQALVALDMGPVSKNGTIDKAWGPYTATAWQKLNARVKGRLGTFGPRSAPPPEAVRRALQLANLLQRFSQSIEVAPGVTLPAGAFASAQAFLRALAARRAAGIDTSGNLDTAANRKRALEILRAFAESMENEDVQIDLATKLGEQGMRRLSQQVNTLLDALGAAEAGIPSYRRQESQQGQAPGYGGRQPYGYGERQPYGRSEGGIGELGTLEGGRGRGGNIGEGGSRRTSMSLDDRIYNIPDVSTFVNDPAQFSFWAKEYIDWVRRSGDFRLQKAFREAAATSRDPGQIVVAMLRKLIAELQMEVMRAPRRDREELQTTLRQRHEAVNDLYAALPKGR
jgi:hypothetical protein